MSSHNRSRQVVRGGMTIMALAISSVLHAQNAGQSTAASPPAVTEEVEEEAATLDRVRVNAYRPAQSIGSATKTNTPLIETPQSVSVVTREELDARGVQNLDEAVRYNAGVISATQGLDNRQDAINIRGFEVGSNSSNVTLDGMRAPRSGGFTQAMFNTWNLERVEILKGPAAVLYGQMAPGGMVNQISKTPTPSQDQLVSLTVDGHGKFQVGFDVGGDATGEQQALWRLVGQYADGPSQIDDTDVSNWFVAPSFTWRFNEDTRVTFLSLYQVDDGDSTFQFLPYQGTVVPAADGYMDNTTFIGEPNWNTYDRTIWTAGWLFEHSFNSNWKLSQGARFTHMYSLYQTMLGGTANLTADRYFNRRAIYAKGGTDGYTADTRLEGKFSTGGLDHHMLVGLDWQYGERDTLRQISGLPLTALQIDIFDPVYLNHPDLASTMTITQFLTYESNMQTGIYAQDQISIGNWRLSLGSRYDWAKTGTYNHFTTAGVPIVPASYVLIRDEAVTSSAGALYLFENINLAPYISYSESFQPNSGTNRQGAPFEPTTGTQWEAGIKYQPATFDGMVTLSAYDLVQNNVLTTDTENIGFSVATGEVNVRGIEFEGRVSPIEGFSVIGSLSRMYSEITRANNATQGNRMIRVPDWSGTLWGDYTFQQGALEGLSVAGGARYVGQTFGDAANSLSIPSYTLFDAALRYSFGQVGNGRLHVSLNLSNLADKRYVTTCISSAACYYGVGRSISASARYVWP